MKIPEQPQEPVEGFRIEWWSFDPVGSYKPGPRRHLAIYIKNRTWSDVMSDPALKEFHAYDAKSTGGDFVNNWMMIGEDSGKMRFGGRNEGWDWPTRPHGRVGGVDSAKDIWAERYETREEALAACRDHATKYVERREADLTKLKAELAELR